MAAATTAALAAAVVAPAIAQASPRSVAARAIPRSSHVLPLLKIGRPPHGPGGATVTSGNWAGYAATQSSGSPTYTSVSGSYVQPTVTCTSTTALTVFWAGLDGYSSSTVEQDGTLAECDGGTVSYYTWWEMYPSNDIQVVGDTVAPGDQITDSVTRSGTNYTLKVTDSTHPADSFTEHETCSCADSSAEFIAERPSGSLGLYPLAQFSPVTFTNIAVHSSAGIGPLEKIVMENASNQVLAQPSAVNKATRSFSVTWERSS